MTSEILGRAVGLIAVMTIWLAAPAGIAAFMGFLVVRTVQYILHNL